MDIVIGKNVIENLTTGMYEDPKIIFREYIQNSADQIDKAIEVGLLKQDEGYIDINLDYKSRKISIKDNATGISQDNFIKILSDIANSEKDRNKDKGFRGIGRLGGLAYCKKLIFKSSFCGEEIESEMIWDGLKLKEILNDHTNKIAAAELIKEIIITKVNKIQKNEHYFEVILEGIYEENDELLSEKDVERYLQAVAPVPYASSFYFRSEIKNFAISNNFKIDEYSIRLNGKEILKQYKTDLYEYPSNDSKETKITAFSLLNENGENVVIESEIDDKAGTIFVTVTTGTTVNRLVPRATVSEGVVIEPIMGVYTDFTNPVTYTLIAGNRIDKQEWTVTVSY